MPPNCGQLIYTEDPVLFVSVRFTVSCELTTASICSPVGQVTYVLLVSTSPRILTSSPGKAPMKVSVTVVDAALATNTLFTARLGIPTYRSPQLPTHKFPLNRNWWLFIAGTLSS